MTDDEIDRVFDRVLDDRRVSRGEKQALRAALEDAAADPNRLGALRRRAFEAAGRRTVSPDVLALLDGLEDLLKALQPEPPAPIHQHAYFSPEDDCAGRIVGLVRTASTIDICVFTITHDQIATALLDASQRRGAEIRIITDDAKTQAPGSDIERLAACGIEVRLDRSESDMHHKFAIFDDRLLLTGSYNWTRSAARENRENIVVTDDLCLVRQFSAAFGRLWEEMA